jgi:hypothetical protein
MWRTIAQESTPQNGTKGATARCAAPAVPVAIHSATHALQSPVEPNLVLVIHSLFLVNFIPAR